MTKPQRIFHCDSGWCIDLDMVTYIDIPKIEDTTVKLKIGIRSNVKNSFIIHEEDFSHVIDDVRHYFKDIVYKKQLLDLPCYSNNMWRLNDRDVINLRIDTDIAVTLDKYIEAEFKVFHTKLKTAWCEWVDYKEGK